MKKIIFKPKNFIFAIATITFCALLFFWADKSSASDYIHTLTFEGLSLRSDAEDIETFIAKQNPPLRCVRTDNEAKETPSGFKPRFRRWSCKAVTRPFLPRIEAQMSGNMITVLDITINEDNVDKFSQMQDYIQNLQQKFEDKGVLFDNKKPKNYGSYTRHENAGSEHQNLQVHLTMPCKESKETIYSIGFTTHNMVKKNISKIKMHIYRNADI